MFSYFFIMIGLYSRIGNEFGETVIEERKIRISAFPSSSSNSSGIYMHLFLFSIFNLLCVSGFVLMIDNFDETILFLFFLSDDSVLSDSNDLKLAPKLLTVMQGYHFQVSCFSVNKNSLNVLIHSYNVLLILSQHYVAIRMKLSRKEFNKILPILKKQRKFNMHIFSKHKKRTSQISSIVKSFTNQVGFSHFLYQTSDEKTDALHSDLFLCFILDWMSKERMKEDVPLWFLWPLVCQRMM